MRLWARAVGAVLLCAWAATTAWLWWQCRPAPPTALAVPAAIPATPAPPATGADSFARAELPPPVPAASVLAATSPAVPVEPAGAAPVLRLRAPYWQRACGDLARRVTAINALTQRQTSFALVQPVVFRFPRRTQGVADMLRGLVTAAAVALVLQRPLACFNIEELSLPVVLGAEPALLDCVGVAARYAAQHPRPAEVPFDPARHPHPPHGDAVLVSAITSTGTAVVAWANRYFLAAGKGAAALPPAVAHLSVNNTPHVVHCALNSVLQPAAATLAHLTGPAVATRWFGGAATEALDGGARHTVALHVRFGGRWNDAVRATEEEAEMLVRCAWNVSVAAWTKQQQQRGRRLAGGDARAAVAAAGLAPPPSPAAVVAWNVASDDQQRLLAVIARVVPALHARPSTPPGLRLAVRFVTHGTEQHVGKWGRVAAAADAGRAEKAAAAADGDDEREDGEEPDAAAEPDAAMAAAEELGPAAKALAVERLWLDFFHISNSDACVVVGSGFPLMACRLSRRAEQPLVSDRGLYVLHTGQGTVHAHARRWPSCPAI